MPELVWVAHPDVAKPGQVGVDAIDAWKGRGWVECDPPPEVDPTQTVPAEATPQIKPPKTSAASLSPKSARGRTSAEGSD